MPTKKGGSTRERERADDDRFELTRAGGMLIVSGGKSYRLGRPTIGQQRRFVEELTEVAELERRANTAAAARAAGDDDVEPDPDAPTEDDVNDAILNWWRTVITELCPGTDWPEDNDDCPAWLLARTLFQEVRAHWLSVPWVPGGSPEDRQAQDLSRLAPLLEQLAPILAAAQQPTT